MKHSIFIEGKPWCIFVSNTQITLIHLLPIDRQGASHSDYLTVDEVQFNTFDPLVTNIGCKGSPTWAHFKEYLANGAKETS